MKLTLIPAQYHQLTRTHKVLGAKQHGITASSSFENTSSISALVLLVPAILFDF